ncbi:MAG TPA: glycine cleavage system protein H [Bryobacteraceae bacterium]|nr:glycine cleavage system protein H [Bryobacteraceae bacterium]
MTVILVLTTFLIFAAVDYYLNRGKSPRQLVDKTHKLVAQRTAQQPSAVPFEPAVSWVDGFALPERMQYHAGHAWCLAERRGVHRIGADEFAAKLAGSVDAVELPRPGRWLRQGQKAWSFRRGGEQVEMVSPVEGEILQVNEEVLKDPALIRKDPYGRGWLMTISVPDEESTFRNLLPPHMLGAWMRQSVERLWQLQPAIAGATAADGGRPVEDLTAGLGTKAWSELGKELFLTR